MRNLTLIHPVISAQARCRLKSISGKLCYLFILHFLTFISFRRLPSPFTGFTSEGRESAATFPSVSRDFTQIEERITDIRGGECPDKTVRVLGNKRAMHL